MNKVTISLITLFFNVLLFAKTGKITISGQVENNTETVVKITHLNNRELVSADLDAKGHFKMTTKIEDGFYILKYGRNSAYIYLYPKDDIEIKFDSKNFDSTLGFKGHGAARNNYLVQKTNNEAKLTEDLEAYYRVSEEQYLINIANVKNAHLELLATYEVEDFFISAEEKSLEYDRLLSIQNFENSYKFYLGDEISVSEDFYKPLKALNINNIEEYRSQPFYRYLVNSAWSKRIEAASDVENMLAILRQVPSQDIAITLVNGFYSKISSNKERAKDYLDLIKRVTKHQPFIDAAEKQYQEVMGSNSLKKGDTSPSFSYENIAGEIVNLNDFKGKYVYIDVWATWCGPCIKQVPYLKKLEQMFHGQNIVFVSISVDKEKAKPIWKQMVEDKELGGVQLFADNSFDSDFMNAYAVNSIPRFILIDPSGNIIDPEAPRPSFDKTRILLDELLN